jgi:hypothetical protein
MHTLAQSAAGGLSGIVDYVRHTLLSSPLAPLCYRLNLHLESFCLLWPVADISHPCKIWGANSGLQFFISHDFVQNMP